MEHARLQMWAVRASGLTTTDFPVAHPDGTSKDLSILLPKDPDVPVSDFLQQENKVICVSPTG